ncbi:MAG: CDP-alcohol phosphatidyltransferase family protein [Paracoccaceae bacterium]|nr:CDP-alcohol phosphatidyltransferase family protein [Paracoccaceae bacterium]
MTDKLTRLWATKNRDDEWWSSFVTSPLAILANYGAVEVPWITPNRITAASFLVAVVATIGILVGGTGCFIAAAVLIHLSHILDCMDGQMARYRQVTSSVGSYYDRLTDQVQVALWFGAAGYAAYAQTASVVPVFLAMIGIAFYGLRGYAKYIALEIETARDPDYAKDMARLKQAETAAGLGYDLRDNWTWFLREQRKFLAFDEGVFIFMLSAALVFDQLIPMLWIFAASQLFWGTYKSWLRGKNIGENRKLALPK